MESWQPSASIETIKKRALFINKIRDFFKQRKVLEVETPILAGCGVTDIHLRNLSCNYNLPGGEFDRTYYLQTSPEFHMKRLLAAGSGPIFQICKSFRDEEQGSLHNPEFTMLEWYQIDYTYFDLMQEVADLVRYLLPNVVSRQISYQALFQKYLNICPLDADVTLLKEVATSKEISLVGSLDKDAYLQILMSTHIEPKLPKDELTFVYDYPVSQAALAKVSKTDCRVAHRFELFFAGLELANGFGELTCPKEQLKRFLDDNELRGRNNLPQMQVCNKFIQALNQGLPECSGVALGVDRLLMILLKKDSIMDVISFASGSA